MSYPCTFTILFIWINDLFVLLQVKDICNELDVRSLCHKILQNVSMLLNADRGSLFLVQGDRPEHSSGNNKLHTSVDRTRPRYLVSKLFDVCSRSTLQEMEKKEEIKIPWGTGIVGYVAESGVPVNIPDAYKVNQWVITTYSNYLNNNNIWFGSG